MDRRIVIALGFLGGVIVGSNWAKIVKAATACKARVTDYLASASAVSAAKKSVRGTKNKNCSNCSALILGKAKFCPKCGVKQ